LVGSSLVHPLSAEGIELSREDMNTIYQ